jgi:hypothetical protein
MRWRIGSVIKDGEGLKEGDEDKGEGWSRHRDSV